MDNKKFLNKSLAAAVGVIALFASALTIAAPARAAVTLEFAQWWEPELPQGAFRALMDDFEKQNPDIKVKLVSGPYSTTKTQIAAGAASKTMSDVVGLDGAWVYDFAKSGALENLSGLMSTAKYNQSELASQIKYQGNTYMIPVVNFIYPLFTNDELLAKAKIKKIPSTRSEFAAAAKAISKLGGSTKGWVIPLSLEQPNGIQNDIMSLLWSSDGSMLKNGKPDLRNKGVSQLNSYVKSLWDAGAISPGAFTLKEQDKVEEFVAGRAGMMIDTLSHVTLIQKNNPSLKFSISPLPVADGYKGKPGIPYASWGIGVSSNSKNKAEAWKLVSYLMSETTNSKLSTIARAFPGNTKSVPDFVNSDAISKKAFAIYQGSRVTNEFTGLPVAEELMRLYGVEFQRYLSGKITNSQLTKRAQAAWVPKF